MADSNYSNVSVSNSTLRFYQEFLQVIKKKKMHSFFINKTRYFFFFFRNDVLCISEYQLCMILCGMTFVVVVGLRKLLQHYKLKQKALNFLKKIRGGAEVEVLRYETSREVTDLGVFPTASLSLSERERWIRDMLKKCLNQMMGFSRNNLLRVISYEVFTLAKTLINARAKGLAGSVSELVKQFILINAPFVVPIVMTFIYAFQININVGFAQLFRQLIVLLLKGSSTFVSLNMLRSIFFIDFESYVNQLTEIEVSKTQICPQQQQQALVDSQSSSVKISYIREKPGIYMTTDPNNNSIMAYQHDFEKEFQEIETLGGKFKQIWKVNGEKCFKWQRNMGDMKKIKKDMYIPLKFRTKTLSDVSNLDSTSLRKSADKIIDAVQESTIVTEKFNEFLD